MDSSRTALHGLVIIKIITFGWGKPLNRVIHVGKPLQVSRKASRRRESPIAEQPEG